MNRTQWKQSLSRKGPLMDVDVTQRKRNDDDSKHQSTQHLQNKKKTKWE
jgi:hypothetical protein